MQTTKKIQINHQNEQNTTTIYQLHQGSPKRSIAAECISYEI